MGSSRKHKEKREKKKHKRSRSRSYEKEVRKKSHKKEKERRRSRERYDDEDAKSQDLRKSFDDSKRYSQQDSSKYNSPSAEDDDDFDVDQLLDSKLSEEFSHSSKRTVDRKSRLQDFRKKLGAGISGQKKYSVDEDDSLEKFLTQQLEEENEVDNQDVEEPPAPDSLNGGQAQLSLSVTEANKLRAKLGLKPLDVTERIPGLGGSEENESKPEEKNEVFVKTENISDLQQAQKFREKLQTMKEKRKIADKLRNVKPLGASGSDDESATAWVKKSRKLQDEKEEARKRAKLLEEMDAEFGIGALVEEEFEKKKKTYSSRDLRGLKVGHDTQAFKEGHQIILTLKDKGVLDEDEDVLQNVNLLDDERHAKNVEKRKKKPDYQPYEEDYDEFGILKKKNLLSKYDEEIHGEQKKLFTLGSASAMDKEKEIEMIRVKLKQQQGVTLEMPNLKVASEYYTSDDMVQFKRPKKKKKLRKREILKADDLLPESDGQSDFDSRIKQENKFEDEWYGETASDRRFPDAETMDVDTEDLENVVIEEDKAEKELYSALNKARKLKQRKIVADPEKAIAHFVEKSIAKADNVEDSATVPIVLNSTAEFCRTLGDIPTYGMSGNRDEDAEELMDFERELIEERQRQELDAQNKGAWNEVDIDETPAEISVRENEPILEEEPDVSFGVSGALKLAEKKGYLDKDNKKLHTGPRASHLQAQSYTIEEKFYDDDKFGKRDRYTGPIQDFREKGSYKPDVNLEYIDDNGRLLNAKEAFRYLSHKFHGKGPGKNKVDKRMKKLDQDTKLKQMSSTDTPLNTVKLLQAKQKETQSPYIVLSGGSKALTQTMISKPKPT